MKTTSTSPLTKLIIDIAIKELPLTTIRQNFRKGEYKPASDKHVVGYVDMLRGKGV